MGNPPGDCGGRCRCFASDSAVARLSWHLGASARWGVSSERRRKDALRLQFAALTRLAAPLPERQRNRLLAIQREIAAHDPLSRTPLTESRALRAFRRSLSGPRFRRQFERWYADEVDQSPLRTFVAEFPDDDTQPAAHREVRLPANGHPHGLVTLDQSARRALVREALAEVRAAVERADALECRGEAAVDCFLVKCFDTPGNGRRQFGSLDFARAVLAARLGIPRDTLREHERGRARTP